MRFVAGFGGARALAIRNQAVGIDEGDAFLALAHMGADSERLAEGEPALAGEAAFGDGAPEDQDVDAAVGAAGGRGWWPRCAEGRAVR